jgi:hypothetical protein
MVGGGSLEPPVAIEVNRRYQKPSEQPAETKENPHENQNKKILLSIYTD